MSKTATLELDFKELNIIKHGVKMLMDNNDTFKTNLEDKQENKDIYLKIKRTLDRFY